jgi:integrase/recombinase XerD
MAMEAVLGQAGHASIESTRIYLHVADDWLASKYGSGVNSVIVSSGNAGAASLDLLVGAHLPRELEFL